MGYFTWTDAAVKPKMKKNGWGYTKKSLIANNGYDGFAKVVCPDDTEIIEEHYNGYGMFGSNDIYELVVDWNKGNLLNIFDNMSSNAFGRGLRPYVHMFVNGVPEEKIIEAVKRDDVLIPARDWKRNVGIAIACDDVDNERLTYPIKITSQKKHYKYAELGISYSTQ